MVGIWTHILEVMKSMHSTSPLNSSWVLMELISTVDKYWLYTDWYQPILILIISVQAYKLIYTDEIIKIVSPAVKRPCISSQQTHF